MCRIHLAGGFFSVVEVVAQPFRVGLRFRSILEGASNDPRVSVETATTVLWPFYSIFLLRSALPELSCSPPALWISWWTQKPESRPSTLAGFAANYQITGMLLKKSDSPQGILIFPQFLDFMRLDPAGPFRVG
jgi:hypothetical protein